jgi:prevent-host-death family protein
MLCSVRIETSVRDLTRYTAGLLRRVDAEKIVITRRSKPVADLVPHRRVNSRWFTPDEVVEIIEHNAADPGLKDDLERLVGQTTDDLGPIR